MKKRKAKTIEDVCQKYRDAMQKMVDGKDAGVSKVSITFGDKKTIVLAERKKKL